MEPDDPRACDLGCALYLGIHIPECNPRPVRTEQEKSEGRARLAEARKQILKDNRAYRARNSGKEVK